MCAVANRFHIHPDWLPGCVGGREAQLYCRGVNRGLWCSAATRSLELGPTVGTGYVWEKSRLNRNTQQCYCCAPEEGLSIHFQFPPNFSLFFYFTKLEHSKMYNSSLCWLWIFISAHSLSITMEKFVYACVCVLSGPKDGSKDFGTDKLHKRTNLPPIFFLFAPLSPLLPTPPPQTTKAFLPKMLELNHGHIVTVASSLGLFSTAGIEVSMIHKGSYTSRHSHHLFFSCKVHGVPASSLGQGDLP